MVEISQNVEQLSVEVAALPTSLSTEALLNFLRGHSQCPIFDLMMQLFRICAVKGLSPEEAHWRVLGFPRNYEFEVMVAADKRGLRQQSPLIDRKSIFTEAGHPEYPISYAKRVTTKRVTWNDVRRIISEMMEEGARMLDEDRQAQQRAEITEETRREVALTFNRFILLSGTNFTYVGLADKHGVSAEEAAIQLAEKLQLEQRTARNIIDDIQRQTQRRLRKAHTDDFRWMVGDDVNRRTCKRGRFGVATKSPAEGRSFPTISPKMAIKVAKL